MAMEINGNSYDYSVRRQNYSNYAGSCANTVDSRKQAAESSTAKAIAETGNTAKKTAADSSISFLALASAKTVQSVTEHTNITGMSFKEMWQTRFPGAYYHTMDASVIPQKIWERNDFPFEKFFQNDVDESILNWRPSGAEPAMSDPKVQERIRSTIGKKSVIVPPALEEKMKNDPELACEVMERVENFITMNDAVRIEREGYYQNPCKGYLISLDENGEIAHFCITSEGFNVSSSEFVEARKAREEKRAEYESYYNRYNCVENRF